MARWDPPYVTTRVKLCMHTKCLACHFQKKFLVVKINQDTLIIPRNLGAICPKLWEEFADRQNLTSIGTSKKQMLLDF